MNLKNWTMAIKQYDIWIADLNPRCGTESGKVRPVVVVQTDLLNDFHPSTLVCPVTTNVHPAASILRVHLRSGKRLHQQCDIMVDRLRAIDNRRLLKKVGSLQTDEILLLKENIAILLGLS